MRGDVAWVDQRATAEWNLHDKNGYGKFIVLEMKERFDALDDSDKKKIIETLSDTTKANQRWVEGKRKKMNSDK